MLDITSIASSSKGNCYRVDDGSTPILIEAGLTFPEIQKRLKYHTSDIKGCLVSHYHMDHARGVKRVLMAGINVYSSQETFDHLELKSHRAHPIKHKESFKIGTWTIVPFDTVHDAEGSFGFLCASGNDRLLFLTDTAYVKYRFKDLTHIMVEANFSLDLIDNSIKLGLVDPGQKPRLIRSHLSIERVLDLLKANDLSKVQEIRLLHLSSNNSDEEMFKRMVQEATGKAVYVEDE